MAAVISNLFSFSKDLPAPFDGLTKKIVSTTSVYGDGTRSTLCMSVITAINSICNIVNRGALGAVGTLDGKGIAEYKVDTDPNGYHIAVYDSTTGNVLASVYDAETENPSNYTLNSKGQDGVAVIMAMFPFFMKDLEFSQNYSKYYDQYIAGFADMDKATEAMAILCDNAYRRIKNETCSAHLKLTLDEAGNLIRLSRVQIEAGNFVPSDTVAGKFKIFVGDDGATVEEVLVEHADFVNKYRFNERTFTPTEQMHIPKLPYWYVIPEDVVDVCKHAAKTTGKPSQMRNFMFRGPAGTGKTEGAKAVAAGLGLPYYEYTCSDGTEIFDFIGQVFPETGSSDSRAMNALDKELESVKAMGGITYENVKRLLNLPELDDIEYDSESVYEMLTGMSRAKASPQDCMEVVLNKVSDKITELMRHEATQRSNGQSFKYVETGFMQAIKNGYVIEIREPSMITRPGVMVGLNSLMEQDGSILLPTGETIKRHPDTVVIVTTNLDYEGCRAMNQSFIDRMSIVKDMELPSAETLKKRAMKVTECDDEEMVENMVTVVNQIKEYCDSKHIDDGVVGMRGLIDWINSTQVTGDPHKSALETVVSKATTDAKARESLISTILEPMFAPKTLKGGRFASAR